MYSCGSSRQQATPTGFLPFFFACGLTGMSTPIWSSSSLKYLFKENFIFPQNSVSFGEILPPLENNIYKISAKLHDKKKTFRWWTARRSSRRTHPRFTPLTHVCLNVGSGGKSIICCSLIQNKHIVSQNILFWGDFLCKITFPYINYIKLFIETLFLYKNH